MHNPVNTFISFGIMVALVGGSFYYVSATAPKEPYLGLAGRGVTPAVGQEIGLPEPRGLLIFVVDPDSPADIAGLQGGDREVQVGEQIWILGGDVITSIDGVEINGVEDAQAILSSKSAGDNVRFTIIRGDSTRVINVTIGER